MRAELAVIVEEFEDARARLRALVAATSGVRWTERPVPTAWSIGECIAHLNLTSAAFVPILQDAMARARRDQGPVVARYRRDAIGWFIWKTSGPRPAFRVKTTPGFVPSADKPAGEIVAEFDRLQDLQCACVRAADGLPIDRVKVISPFDARVRYSLYSALTILPRHQHRHLWQAEQVRDKIRQ
jgi:hypothetical protein